MTSHPAQKGCVSTCAGGTYHAGQPSNLLRGSPSTSAMRQFDARRSAAHDPLLPLAKCRSISGAAGCHERHGVGRPNLPLDSTNVHTAWVNCVQVANDFRRERSDRVGDGAVCERAWVNSDPPHARPHPVEQARLRRSGLVAPALAGWEDRMGAARRVGKSGLSCCRSRRHHLKLLASAARTGLD